MANGNQPKPKSRGSANFKNRPRTKYPIVPTPPIPLGVKGKKPTKEQIMKAYTESKDFFNNYLESPKYLERLNLQEYSNPETVINERRKRLNSGKIRISEGEGSGYKDRIITVDPGEMATYGFTPEETVSHEVSHQVGAIKTGGTDYQYEALRPNEVEFINERNMSYPAWPEHDARAWEAKADVDTFRFMLKKDNIYDTGTQDFTPEHLKKAKEKYRSNRNLNRLFNNFSDKDLIDVMNKIAYQPTSIPQQTAKYGGSIMKNGKKNLSGRIDFSSMYEVIPEAKSGASVAYIPKPTRRKAQNGLVADPTDPYGSYSGIDFKPSMPKPVNIPGTPPSYVPQVAFGELGRRMDEQLAPPDVTANSRRNITQADILGPLSLISSIIPEGDISRKYVRPEDLPSNQQYTYGLGSQAIYRSGGHMTDSNPTGYMPYIPAWDEDAYIGLQANYGGDFPVPAEELAEYLDMDMNEDMYIPMAKSGWIQKATASIKRRGTEGVCTGSKFGSSSCPPGSKRYNLAKTFRKMAKNRKKGEDGMELYDHGGIISDPSYPFYPTEYTEAKYEKGGSVSPEKAKKILKDGTVRGKKLTDKQRRFFGAMASAAEGDFLPPFTEDPDPKKQRAKVKAAGEKIGQFKNEAVDPNRSYYRGNTIDRTARYADLVNQLVAEGIDPFSEQGIHARNYGMTQYSPSFSRDIGIQIKSLQADPSYSTLTPEQRLENFYRRSNSNPEVQKYLTMARSLSGGPSAFYQGRALGRMKNGGSLQPYFEEGVEYDLSPFTIKRLLAQGYTLE